MGKRTRSENKMTVALYARVSTTDQNCEMQLSALREYCERRKWDIVEEYVDTGWSGVKITRPALDRLKRDARQRKFDGVLVWKLDRWGRSLTDSISGIQELVSLGIRFVAMTQNLDTDESNPMARFLLHIMAAFAELEREMIRERVNAGIKQHKANLALGRIGKDLHTRSGKDLPTGRPRRIFDRQKARDLKAKGFSLRSISRQLGVGLGTVQRELSAT